MKRVKLVIAYDGTNYHGWQLQPNGISIEAVLNQTLTDLLREPITVIGASRTDSGVHALGNVAVFDTENRMPADKICFALNQRLPEDIRIQSSEEVPLSWHPRKQNCVKTYEYKILNRKIDMPVGRLYTYFCYFPMDVEKMRQAAAYLVGEHDFKSFCTVRTQAEETVRTIYSLKVDRGADDVVTIRITGSGFLYNMVRIIAGTLLRVGTGLYPPEKVEEILDAKDRQAAGPTLPAKGLTLVSLEYEKELKPEIAVSNKYWEYQLVQREIPYKKKGYLVIRRCADEEFQSLVTRLVHQLARNGARWIYVADMEAGKNRLDEGQQYGYYEMKRSHCYLEMEKEVRKDCSAGAEAAAGCAVSLRKDLALCLSPLEPENYLSWLEMHNEAFFSVPGSATYDEKMIEEEEKDGSRFFFLCNGAQKVGTLVLTWDQNRKQLTIDMISIKKEFACQGYGRTALMCVEQLAKEQNMMKLHLLVADTNKAARALYQKAGFYETGRRPDFFCTESNLMTE
ncbi:MAG: tRNA pseudouridine(38-40) synthase TruA [Lachnospiraceae bacterium]|nr:tRNA pseudouridine(38-40) synthase TruA [Lachnospiraceae bacterium]